MEPLRPETGHKARCPICRRREGFDAKRVTVLDRVRHALWVLHDSVLDDGGFAD